MIGINSMQNFGLTRLHNLEQTHRHVLSRLGCCLLLEPCNRIIKPGNTAYTVHQAGATTHEVQHRCTTAHDKKKGDACSKRLTCARADQFHCSLPAPQLRVGKRPHARHSNAHLLQASPTAVSSPEAAVQAGTCVLLLVICSAAHSKRAHFKSATD